MHIAITGGTGFVGSYLTSHLEKQGHTLYILTRNPQSHKNTECIKYVGWLSKDANPTATIPTLDAVINLAGKSINNRWTEQTKKEIKESRIQATRAVLEIVKAMKPSVLINASAVGYYGNSLDQTFTEGDPAGSGFLAETTRLWEEEAAKAQEFGVRVVYARFGIILDKDEGALPRIALPYQLFAGGKLGTGQQWMSWVHINDVVRMIDFALHQPELNGPLNVTAPNPHPMNEFGKILAEVLHRPHWLPAPSFALKTVLGEMSELVLEGQKVLPDKALRHGYKFEFETLYPALVDLYQQ
ncbi:TIGR01777 family oxidoreductase [Bacillus tianshenii]|nr:TIGR01777 family oxidoreductase [Bacillus tianshenii]